MQNFLTIIIVLLFLLIFGCVLYIFTTFLFRLFEEADIEKRTKKIWIWRASIFLIIAYISIILWINKDFLSISYLGSSTFFLYVSLTVFFISLVEMVVIDMLLPDTIKMWKRIVIEMGVFALLCLTTLFIIKVYSVLAG